MVSVTEVVPSWVVFAEVVDPEDITQNILFFISITIKPNTNRNIMFYNVIDVHDLNDLPWQVPGGGG